MIIRQEERTPIGDYFHDSGLFTVFNALTNEVDEFEVDTDKLCSWIDNLITNLKGLKSQIKKCESEYQKYLQQQSIRDMVNRGVE